MQRMVWAALVLGACVDEPGTVIGPDGGTVEAGPVTLDIPAGALDEDVAIQITADPAVETDQLGLSEVYAFEPHGLEFLDPVTVTFAHDGGDLPLVKWSDDGRAWSILSTDPASTDTATSSPIDHFSWGYVAEGMDGMMMR